MGEAVDQKYYQVVRPKSVTERLLIRARSNIYADFVARMKPSESDLVLDVGISDVINDGANVLEREYPHLHRVTACGLSDAEAFRQTFPQVQYRRIVPNEPLPFSDDSFSIATANAVLEHVGSKENQVFFLNELSRVAKKVFISVPHRFFPLEHHTMMPFLHYHSASFRIACRLLGKHEWADTSNLILMTRGRLARLAMQIDRTAQIGYTGLRMGVASSNLYMVLE